MTEPEPAPRPVPPAPVLPSPAAEREPSAGSLLLRVGLVLLTPLIALAVIAARPRRFDLWVDNGGDAPVVIEVQGRTRELPPRSTAFLDGLRGGQVELRWREGEDQRVERASVPVEPFAPRGTWVWNVGDRTPRYWVVSRGYGTTPTPPPRPLEERGQGVWRLPEELLPGLDQPLPEQVNSRGAPGAVRSTAWSEHQVAAVAPPRLILHVDPGLTVPVRLFIDGYEVTTIPPGRRFRADDLRPGRHLLEATVIDANGNPGQSAQVDALLEAEPLAPPAGWVWTPFQPRQYWVVAHGLGEVAEPLPPRRRFVPPAALFRIPDGVQPGLDELPLGVRLPQGVKGAVVHCLWSETNLRDASVKLDPSQFDLRRPGEGPPLAPEGR